MVAYISDPQKEGTVYDGPSFVDVTKDDVISIFDKWEDEVRVIARVSSFVQLNNLFFFDLILISARGKTFSMGCTCDKSSSELCLRFSGPSRRCCTSLFPPPCK